MDRTFKTQSLLPWLDPGSSKLHLEFSLQRKPLEVHSKFDSAFRLLDSSSPLFHLVHGSYRSPSFKSVKEIFLLVQKDHCSFTEKSIPFSNSKIDEVWLEALKFEGVADRLEYFDSLFERSVGETETFYPLWQSLFYCEKRKCYFHPPCPQCGKLLELCQHDEILSAAGLPLYTTTLERFLFCPVCHVDRSGSDFFYHDEDDEIWPVVKNLRALVDGFTQLVRNGLGGDGFPCQTCKEQGNCYSSELAFQRIKVFAFYPFRLLITDAAQLPAQDFISMLAGASCTEMKKQPYIVREPGRLACLESFRQQGTEGIELFFENDTRRFLEILYLKIAFLEQIARTAFVARKHLKHPDLRLTMDQFWVDFPNVQGLLPSFWNFKVKSIALGVFPSDDISFIKVPESLGLYSLALLWFNTLLVNREQSVGDVQHALATLLNKENDFESAPEFFSSSTSGCGAFGPENVFWHPVENQLPPFWLDLWEKVLGLGWSLLQASFGSTHFSDILFAGEVSKLAGEVKKTLFASRDESVVVQEKDDYDFDILQILLSIKEKWKEDTVVVKEEVADEEVADDEVAVELEPDVETTGSTPENTEPASLESDLEKTVILSVEQLDALKEKGDQQDPEDVGKEISGTTGGGDFEAGEDLEKTVIMNLNDLGSMLPDNGSTAALEQQDDTPQPQKNADDDLSETVIISLEEVEKLKKGKNGNK